MRAAKRRSIFFRWRSGRRDERLVGDGGLRAVLFLPALGQQKDQQQTFWHRIARVLPGGARTRRTDVYIKFVDLSGEKLTPDRDTMTIRLTCTNGDWPARLPFGNEEGDFQLEGGGPITRIVALTKPTDTLQPPDRKGLLWRLISQLSLNYLSLVSEGGDAFQEILRLHNFAGSLFGREADRRDFQRAERAAFRAA